MLIKNVLMDENEGLYIDFSDLIKRIEALEKEKIVPIAPDPEPEPQTPTENSGLYVDFPNMTIDSYYKFYCYELCTYDYEDVSYDCPYEYYTLYDIYQIADNSTYSCTTYTWNENKKTYYGNSGKVSVKAIGGYVYGENNSHYSYSYPQPGNPDAYTVETGTISIKRYKYTRKHTGVYIYTVEPPTETIPDSDIYYTGYYGAKENYNFYPYWGTDSQNPGPNNGKLPPYKENRYKNVESSKPVLWCSSDEWYSDGVIKSFISYKNWGTLDWTECTYWINNSYGPTLDYFTDIHRLYYKRTGNAWQDYDNPMSSKYYGYATVGDDGVLSRDITDWLLEDYASFSTIAKMYFEEGAKLDASDYGISSTLYEYETYDFGIPMNYKFASKTKTNSILFAEDNSEMKMFVEYEYLNDDDTRPSYVSNTDRFVMKPYIAKGYAKTYKDTYEMTSIYPAYYENRITEFVNCTTNNYYATRCPSKDKIAKFTGYICDINNKITQKDSYDSYLRRYYASKDDALIALYDNSTFIYSYYFN